MVPDETHRTVTSDHPCVPCHNKGCDGKEISICMEELGAEEVKKAISEVIASTGGG
jgi:ADP-heptose:LPS heptosyltransferase